MTDPIRIFRLFFSSAGTGFSNPTMQNKPSFGFQPNPLGGSHDISLFDACNKASQRGRLVLQNGSRRSTGRTSRLSDSDLFRRGSFEVFWRSSSESFLFRHPFVSKEGRKGSMSSYLCEGTDAQENGMTREQKIEKDFLFLSLRERRCEMESSGMDGYHRQAWYVLYVHSWRCIFPFSLREGTSNVDSRVPRTVFVRVFEALPKHTRNHSQGSFHRVQRTLLGRCSSSSASFPSDTARIHATRCHGSISIPFDETAFVFVDEASLSRALLFLKRMDGRATFRIAMGNFGIDRVAKVRRTRIVDGKRCQEERDEALRGTLCSGDARSVCRSCTNLGFLLPMDSGSLRLPWNP